MTDTRSTPMDEALKQLRDYANREDVHRWDREKLLLIADRIASVAHSESAPIKVECPHCATRFPVKGHEA